MHTLTRVQWCHEFSTIIALYDMLIHALTDTLRVFLVKKKVFYINTSGRP